MATFSPDQLDQLKRSNDLLDLAAHYSVMKKISGHEYAGPCPVCGGTDRFHVDTKSQRWMCSNCTGRETWQDVIAFRRHVTGETFVAAVEALGGRADRPVLPIVPRQPDRADPPRWTDPHWQRRIQRTVAEACQYLDDDAGDAARAYLADRAIDIQTAHYWLLGYAPISPPWDTSQQQRSGGPSLTLPYLRHDDDRVMAVRYRRLNPTSDSDRYINEAGSTVRLFGLHLLNLNARHLVVVEGEINAISIWQAGHDLDDSSEEAGPSILTVVSIGSQSLSERALGDVARLSRDFGSCLVWCDQPDKAQQLRAVVASANVQMRRSPTIGGTKVDANDLLQRGQLAPFLKHILTSTAVPA